MSPGEGQEGELSVAPVCTDALLSVPCKSLVSPVLLALQYCWEQCQAVAEFGPQVPSWGFPTLM